MSKLLKIALTIVGVLLLVLLLNSDASKNFYKKMMGEYEETDRSLIRKIETLQLKMEEDSLYYSKELRNMDSLFNENLQNANIRYEQLNRKYKRNAKELEDYRNSGFDDKFLLFSRAVIGKDTVQGQ